MKKKTSLFAVVRLPVFMEDEGRHFLEGVFDSLKEAKAYIKREDGPFYKTGDYIIMKEIK